MNRTSFISYVSFVGIALLVMGIEAFELYEPKDDLNPAGTGLTPSDLKCACSVRVNGSDVTHDAGFVEQEVFLQSHTHASQSKSLCRVLRHRCRRLCAERLEQDFVREDVSQKQIGYHLCLEHRQATPVGGLNVFSEAKLDGCPQHLPISPYQISPKLCCGFTFIRKSSEDEKALMTFGWNPDCMAQVYVL